MFVKTLTIQLLDVLGRDIAADVRFAVTNSSGTSQSGPFSWGPGGMSSEINDSVVTLEIWVTNEDYASSHLFVLLDTAVVGWNNPSCQVTAQNSTLDVVWTIIRVKLASALLTTSELARRVKGGPYTSLKLNDKTRIQDFQLGVWLDPDDQTQRYLGLEDMLSPGEVRTCIDVAGTMLNDPDGADWERFNTATSPPDLSSLGSFLWVEYGSVDSRSGKPKFLVGLWIPKSADGTDYIVNLGHSPGAWNLPGVSASYPYYVYPGDWPRFWPQPHVHFGVSYFFNTPSFSFYFAAQLCASGKSPILIMPVAPLFPDSQAGLQYKPLDSQAGMHRLLLEVGQFLVQEGFVNRPPLGQDDLNAVQPSANTSRNGTSITSARRANPLETVAVAAHSSGITWLLALISQRRLNSNQVYVSNLYEGDGDAFARTWREIWDLDLSFTGTGSRENYQQLLPRWFGAQSDFRRLRMYHSSQTCPKLSASLPRLFDKASTWTSWAVMNPKRASSNAAVVAEDHRSQDDRIVAAFFSDAYTSSPQAVPGLPDFPHPEGGAVPWYRLHQFPMIIGFGHACRLFD